MKKSLLFVVCGVLLGGCGQESALESCKGKYTEALKGQVDVNKFCFCFSNEVDKAKNDLNIDRLLTTHIVSSGIMYGLAYSAHLNKIEINNIAEEWNKGIEDYANSMTIAEQQRYLAIAKKIEKKCPLNKFSK